MAAVDADATNVAASGTTISTIDENEICIDFARQPGVSIEFRIFNLATEDVSADMTTTRKSLWNF